jgi:phage terminase large subunit-like protein
LRESTYRRARLGQWVDAVEEPWIAPQLWATCENGAPINLGDEVVIALDGSFSQDCTALVAATVSETPHIDVVGLWENETADPDYRVPVLEVEDTIRRAAKDYRVLEVAADPFRWQRTLQVLAEERIPIAEYPQSPQRMTPATTGLYEAVVNRQVSHSGDARLARHVAQAVVKTDSRGTRLVKEHKHSKRRIDLAVAAVMAHDRARHHAQQPRAAIYVLD